ncbi:hypothetical protein CYJ26_04100 [Actinomyces urogenitalis]|uniref:Uncharacterized protein n=1 Tax=Actinomyces urogenitalis TaxID=103621 RepID=A0A2I1KUL0_9ACTO|nr:hypothetical protein CYJ26_04100 [Actinomyces urogenitalis]
MAPRGLGSPRPPVPRPQSLRSEPAAPGRRGRPLCSAWPAPSPPVRAPPAPREAPEPGAAGPVRQTPPPPRGGHPATRPEGRPEPRPGATSGRGCARRRGRETGAGERDPADGAVPLAWLTKPRDAGGGGAGGSSCGHCAGRGGALERTSQCLTGQQCRRPHAPGHARPR